MTWRRRLDLTHMLKSNVIVMVSTGKIGTEAGKYVEQSDDETRIFAWSWLIAPMWRRFRRIRRNRQCINRGEAQRWKSRR